MRKVALLGLALIVCAGSAFAATGNNILGPQPTPLPPGHFTGVADRDETVQFPTTADTWQVQSYPWWWQTGDTVFGTHTVSLATVNHADVSLKISNNQLALDGYFDLDFRVAGTTVGSIRLHGTDGNGYITGSFDFASMTPPFELRYYETDTVYSGGGSLQLDDAGLSTVVFTGGGPVPVLTSSWGKVKALYR